MIGLNCRRDLKKFANLMSSNPVFGMHKVTKMFDLMADKLLKDKHGINYNKFIVLARICSSINQEITQKKIADFSNLTEASISRIVEEFLLLGHVNKEINPQNRSMHFLTATESGLNLFYRAIQSLDDESKKFLSLLSDTEITQLNTLLNKINQIICQ